MIGVPSRSIVYPLLLRILMHTHPKLGYYMSFLWVIRAATLLVFLPREPSCVPLCYVSPLFIIS